MQTECPYEDFKTDCFLIKGPISNCDNAAQNFIPASIATCTATEDSTIRGKMHLTVTWNANIPWSNIQSPDLSNIYVKYQQVASPNRRVCTKAPFAIFNRYRGNCMTDLIPKVGLPIKVVSKNSNREFLGYTELFDDTLSNMGC